jgi:hypothetical protein
MCFFSNRQSVSRAMDDDVAERTEFLEPSERRLVGPNRPFLVSTYKYRTWKQIQLMINYTLGSTV